MGDKSEKPTSLSDFPTPGGIGWRDFIAGYGEGSASSSAFMLHMSNLHQAPTLDVDLVSHCNLNCAACCHFSPAAEPSFLSLDDYGRDLDRIARVQGLAEYFAAFCLMGGEPLLHPELPSFIRLTHERLPGARVRVVTNGLLVKAMGDEFWEAMRLPRTDLLMTSYPCGLDYEELYELAKAQDVDVAVGGGVTPVDDDAYFLRTPLDETGSQKPNAAFAACPLGGSTMQLLNGKIFPCNRGALFGIINKRFGTSFAHAADDYLELDAIGSVEEVDGFRRRAHSMCRYCASTIAERIDWHRSEVDRYEWLMRPDECGA